MLCLRRRRNFENIVSTPSNADRRPNHLCRRPVDRKTQKIIVMGKVDKNPESTSIRLQHSPNRLRKVAPTSIIRSLSEPSGAFQSPRNPCDIGVMCSRYRVESSELGVCRNQNRLESTGIGCISSFIIFLHIAVMVIALYLIYVIHFYRPF